MASEANTSRDNLTPAIRLQNLTNAHPEIRFVRFQILDYGAIIRTRLVTVRRAIDIASRAGDGIVTGGSMLTACLPNDDILWELIDTTENIWVPGWDSLRHCTYAPSHASVMCCIREGHDTGIKGYERDPRSKLREVVESAHVSHGVNILVGFEIEFVLLPSSTSLEPLDTVRTAYGAANIRHPSFTVVEDAVALIEKADIDIWGFHSEAGQGMYEISLSPLDPVAAVDALIFAQETIKTVAVGKGYHATMHPKPFEQGGEVGLHFHMSLSKPQLGDSFLAGVLRHFRALCALWTPNVDSYARLSQRGGWVSWGWTNRTCLISRRAAAHWEFRSPDGTANMYLVLAATIGIGMEAVATGKSLAMKPMPNITFGPTDEERQALGITDRIPRDIEEALSTFNADGALQDVLGDAMWRRYIFFKNKDSAALSTMTLTERRNSIIRGCCVTASGE